MLLFANNIWQDTSEELVLERTLDNVDYLLSSTTFLKEGSYEIEEYLSEEPLIDRVDTAISSLMVFNKGNKPGNYTYFPFSGQDNLEDPVDVIPTLVYSMDAMTHLDNVLAIEGEIPTNSQEMMISSLAQLELQEIYNITITPGYTLDVSIGQRFPQTDRGEFELQHFQLLDFENITITGIFRHNGAVSMTRSAFNLGIFQRSVIFPLTEETFSSEIILQMDRNTLFRKFMISLKTEAILEEGISGAEELLSTIANRIKSRFWHSINKVESDALDTLEVEFKFSFNAGLLYYPLIVLSLLLTHYAIGLLVGGREEQLLVLRTRGANDLDISVLYGFEFLIVVTSSLLIATPLAILFSLMIPALSPQGIDIDTAREFYSALTINLSALYQLALFVVGILSVSFSYHVFRTIFYPRLSLSIDIFKLVHYSVTILLIVLLVLQIRDISRLVTLSQETYIPNVGDLLQEAIITLSILWLLFSQVLADIIIFILKSTTNIYFRASKDISFFMEKTFTRTNMKSKILVFYFIFIFSLLVFSSSLYSTYDTFYEESDLYLQGGDLRIHTERTFANYSDNISAIEGVNHATGIYKTNVYVGQLEYTVYAVDPQSYLEVGYWQYSNDSVAAKNSIKTIMDPNQPNMIVSPYLLNKLDFNISDSVNIIGLAGVYNSEFTISSTIVTAPGLGISSIQNPELNQPTTGYMIININYLDQYFDIGYTNYFLASLADNANHDSVFDNLETEDNILEINPKPINQNFIGVFISPYLPNPIVLLFFVMASVAIVGSIIISMTTDYLLHERRQEFALMIAIGGTRKKVSRFIYTEIFTLTASSVVIGIFYGLFMSNLSLGFYIPFTIRRLFVPLTFGLNWLIMGVLTIAFMTMVYIIVRRSIKAALPDNITDILLRG